MSLKKSILYITTATLFAGTIGIATNPDVTANAATWKTGTPKALFGNTSGAWGGTSYTKLPHPENGKKGKYYFSYSAFLGGNYKGGKDSGYQPIKYYFNKDKKYVAEQGASLKAARNAHYQSLGKGYYKITSGGKGNSKKSLKYELQGPSKNNKGYTILVKVHNPKKISIWKYLKGATGKTEFQGVFVGVNAKGLQ
ncbi:hypothetical protein MOO44_08625 [Nicoliella spurrieriana]|uniref:Uncharacterized protein n=1 Tax=Nicoliella spurrieriana TaxID=2925830 RepID=A0A976X5T9_9LACO|nr:hypothetical protein [Nicoliella spurrieriana]UQS86912.1 hypothetical protein MOO44_08625 [Nicoliella spurrieriana]